MTLGIGAKAPTPKGYELLSVASGAFGLDLRSYLLASVAGRGGKYLLEAALVLAVGKAARTLTEVELYTMIGVATLVVVVATSSGTGDPPTAGSGSSIDVPPVPAMIDALDGPWMQTRHATRVTGQTRRSGTVA